ncbi:Clp protease N-terminal domain-containing protein [Agarilytica rhodophyticola]|uniref:Clp protease N-terminal domain-containing protein n=1 Tax=Agarilytica rhodophyticola TaxID=1737490 RepID=UPI000CD9860E|nr:Clp protease N-terminal domain-containing protein [Agarilytica rhodophyticola]
MMFNRVMLRFRDMKTISRLITGADEQAHISGEEMPGAEHFVLSALNLEDGSAKRVFDKIGIDTEKFKNAINQQYANALASIGIDNKLIPEPLESNKILHNAQPSAQELMRSLYTLKKSDKLRPLLGVHVINAASKIEQGIVARAFKILAIDKEKLNYLIKEELESC